MTSPTMGHYRNPLPLGSRPLSLQATLQGTPITAIVTCKTGSQQSSGLVVSAAPDLLSLPSQALVTPQIMLPVPRTLKDPLRRGRLCPHSVTVLLEELDLGRGVEGTRTLANRDCPAYLNQSQFPMSCLGWLLLLLHSDSLSDLIL